MICKVKAAIKKYELITDEVKSIAVGLSGGADSVSLLHILSSLKDEYGIILKAVHINHNIRGQEALRDEDFVRSFCQKLGIELLVYSVDVPSLAKEKKLSVEECGRTIRYQCFEKAGCDAVAVAHTLSDSIETMLFNLARGTGVKGLSGISPKREPNIIRPLIDCTRDEVEKYCRDNSLDYVTDSTNLSDDYTRNHIRHNIVPAFARINGDFESAFSRAMNVLREENMFVEESALKLLDLSGCDDGYSIPILSQAHPAVLKKCLHYILKQKMSKPPEAKHIELCCELIKLDGKRVEVAKDFYAYSDSGILRFRHKKIEAGEWTASFSKNRAETPYGCFILCDSSDITYDSFDAEKIKGELYLSSRKAGDTFTFKKRKVTKSVKKLFNEMKLPVEKRNETAILHDDDGVVWIEGIGVNAKYTPNKNSQKIITIKKDGVKC